MITNKPFEQADNLADRAALSADHAIRATQRVTHDALDNLAGTVEGVHQQVSPLLQQASEQARRAGDSTLNYVKSEPVKAVLIAAATGAALMAMLGLMSRRRDRA